MKAKTIKGTSFNEIESARANGRNLEMHNLTTCIIAIKRKIKQQPISFELKTFCMNKLFFTTVCFLFLSTAINAQKTKPGKGIVGTWRLVYFADFDTTTNAWIYRYGKNPRGYFTYTKSGVLSINISSDNPLKMSEEAAKKYTVNLSDYIENNSFGYFGTYTLEPEKGRVIHHVKGGTIPWYTDTEQPRQIQLKGDTAIIGDSKTTRRVLVRVD